MNAIPKTLLGENITYNTPGEQKMLKNGSQL